jgi:hypothetical protein
VVQAVLAGAAAALVEIEGHGVAGAPCLAGQVAVAVLQPGQGVAERGGEVDGGFEDAEGHGDLRELVARPRAFAQPKAQEP